MNPHLGAGGHIFIHLQSGYLKKTVNPKHGIYYFFHLLFTIGQLPE
jgi:RNA processing factor Prp31